MTPTIYAARRDTPFWRLTFAAVRLCASNTMGKKKSKQEAVKPELAAKFREAVSRISFEGFPWSFSYQLAPLDKNVYAGNWAGYLAIRVTLTVGNRQFATQEHHISIHDSIDDMIKTLGLATRRTLLMSLQDSFRIDGKEAPMAVIDRDRCEVVEAHDFDAGVVGRVEFYSGYGFDPDQCECEDERRFITVGNSSRNVFMVISDERHEDGFGFARMGIEPTQADALASLLRVAARDSKQRQRRKSKCD